MAEQKQEKGNESYMVPALMKGLQIIGLYNNNQRVLTVNDFAAELGVSASSIYRTVVTLNELGYLKKLNRNAYELGPMVLSRGFCYLASREIVEIAAPYIIELRNETSASCHLAIREGVEAVYLYRAHSPQRLVVNVPVGSRFICHSVAIGRALLTGLDDDSLTELFSGVAIDGYSPSVPSSLPQLKQLIAVEREQNFSFNQSDLSASIATPITNYAGEVVAAINVSAPDSVMGNLGVRDTLTKRLLQTAAQITHELGG